MRHMFKNTGSNVVLPGVKLAITFMLTPVIVRALGNYDYGIWEMVLAVVGYMGILNIGFTPTISRFAATFNAQADDVSMQRLFSTALAYLGLAGSVALIIFCIWA